MSGYGFKEGDLVVSEGWLCQYVKDTERGTIVNNMGGFAVRLYPGAPLVAAVERDVLRYIEQTLKLNIYRYKELSVGVGYDYIEFEFDECVVSVPAYAAVELVETLKRWLV